jgi:hypothetical protein
MWLQYDFGDGPVIDGRKTVLFCAWLSRASRTPPPTGRRSPPATPTTPPWRCSTWACLEEQQGQPDAARAAYRQAMSLGDDELAQRASEAFEELD